MQKGRPFVGGRPFCYFCSLSWPRQRTTALQAARRRERGLDDVNRAGLILNASSSKYLLHPTRPPVQVYRGTPPAPVHPPQADCNRRCAEGEALSGVRGVPDCISGWESATRRCVDLIDGALNQQVPNGQPAEDNVGVDQDHHPGANGLDIGGIGPVVPAMDTLCIGRQCSLTTKSILIDWLRKKQ